MRVTIKPLLILIFATMTILFTVGAQAETFREGVDYTELKQPIRTENPSKIEVREFFWFGCPHCFKLETYVHKFAKNLPEGVEFLQTPAPLNKSWMNHAHAFYVMQALGKIDVMLPALFDEIHVSKKRTMSQDDLAAFFGRYDVSKKDFNKVFQSFTVRTKVRQAEAFSKAARLDGVPAMVVNGKYVVGTRMAKNFTRMIQIVRFLVEKEKLTAQSRANQNGVSKG